MQRSGRRCTRCGRRQELFGRREGGGRAQERRVGAKRGQVTMTTLNGTAGRGVAGVFHFIWAGLAAVSIVTTRLQVSDGGLGFAGQIPPAVDHHAAMAFAPPKNSDGAKLQTKMSTWTPLNHQLMNDKVFEERGSLLGKWFDKWSDAQRRKVLCDLFERCNVSQLKFCNHHLQARVPRESLDFTAFLPRVLSLYIFSFLDPRSLCRCAQVSWHWKTLAELDQLWMLKCLRFGWYINFTPTPFEQSIWKRQYIEMVKELNVTRPRTPPKESFVVIDVQPIAKEALDLKSSSHLIHRHVSSKAQSKGGKDLPPWRSSDKHPTDTLRFNYLDNYDPMEQARQGRQSTLGTSNRSHQDPERKKRPSSASYKLRKAKSLMSLAGGFANTAAKAPSRPSWAAHQSDYPVTKATAKSLAQSNAWNAGIRPAPIRAAIPAISKRGMKAYTRTSRSSPTAALFESQPWELPASDQGSDEE